MFNKYREKQFRLYNDAREYFIKNFGQLIELERYFSDFLFRLFGEIIEEIKFDYNETNYLFPFWQNYPPDDRGRQPKGDQFPWIEVGEHVIGAKIARHVAENFNVRDIGLPTGADQRFVVENKTISKITKSFTSSCWLFVDIKSVGPRDDQDHTVMSHNQISGSGYWDAPERGVANKVMKAVGQRASHDFHCGIPPIYVLSDGAVAPAVLIVVKPVYAMLNLENKSNKTGQPLGRIMIISIPNGLLLEEKPGYLSKYPQLIFPGKDDKRKNPLKLRCRISFPLLRTIAAWRVQSIAVDY